MQSFKSKMITDPHVVSYPQKLPQSWYQLILLFSFKMSVQCPLKLCLWHRNDLSFWNRTKKMPFLNACRWVVLHYVKVAQFLPNTSVPHVLILKFQKLPQLCQRFPDILVQIESGCSRKTKSCEDGTVSQIDIQAKIY